MKRIISVILLLTAVAFSLFSCSGKSSYVPDCYTIAVNDTVTGKISPFYAKTEGDILAVNLVAAPLMHKNTDGEMVPYIGNITSKEITADDGSKHLLATVTVNNGMKFSDNYKVSIDDVLFMYYIFADPCYSGYYSRWHENPIVGIDKYYYDDPDWSGELPDFKNEAEKKYSPKTIKPNDLYFYFYSSSINGEWNGDLNAEAKDGKTWYDVIVDTGHESELNLILTDKDKQLDLIAKIYAENYSSDYDYTSWWANKLLQNYIKDSLKTIDVKSVDGIKRVDDYTCTVEFSKIDVDAVSILNVPVAAKHNYSSIYGKGNGDAAASSGQKEILIGAGPYEINNTEGGIITLKSNTKYFEGESKIKKIEIRRVAQEDIITNIMLHQISVGILTGDNDEIIAKAKEHGLSYIETSNGVAVYDKSILDFSSFQNIEDMNTILTGIYLLTPVIDQSK